MPHGHFNATRFSGVRSYKQTGQEAGHASFPSAIGDVNAGFVLPHEDSELFRVACCLLQVRESRVVFRYDRRKRKTSMRKLINHLAQTRVLCGMVLGTLAAKPAAREEIQSQPAGDTNHV